MAVLKVFEAFDQNSFFLKVYFSSALGTRARRGIMWEVIIIMWGSFWSKSKVFVLSDAVSLFPFQLLGVIF